MLEFVFDIFTEVVLNRDAFHLYSFNKTNSDLYILYTY